MVLPIKKVLGLTFLLLAASILVISQYTAPLVSALTVGAVPVDGSGGTGDIVGVDEKMNTSLDGRYIAYTSRSSALISNDTTYNVVDAYVTDTVQGTTELASITPSGNQAQYGVETNSVSMTKNGRYVLMTSKSPDMDSTGVASSDHTSVYVRDRHLGITRTVELGGVNLPNSPAMSELRFGGRGLSEDGNLVLVNKSLFIPGNPAQYVYSSYVKNLVTGQDYRVDLDYSGTPFSGIVVENNNSSLSCDGRFIAFTASVNGVVNETPARQGATTGVYLRDILSGVTTRVVEGVGAVSSVSISCDGNFLTFISADNGLTSGDLNSLNSDGGKDAYMFDIQNEELTLVSVDGSQQQYLDSAYVKQRIVGVSKPIDSVHVAFTVERRQVSGNSLLDTMVRVRNLRTGVTSSYLHDSSNDGNRHASSPTFTTDGDSVYYTSKKNNGSTGKLFRATDF